MTDEAMSPLRRRMIEDMTIRKLGRKTQQDYIQIIKKLAAFLGRSPDTATFEDLRRFQLHVVASGVGAAAINRHVSALRFFFRVTLKRYAIVEHTHFIHEPCKLPLVLSQQEVARLLDAAPGLKYKAALSVAYGAGLRAAEVVSLKVCDIDSKRMVIRVEQGKGRKDRNVMLSPLLLDLLREWWKAARPQGWLFPGRDPVQPMTTRQLNRQLIWPGRAYVLILRTPSGDVDAVTSRNKEFVSNLQKAVEQAFVVRAREPSVSEPGGSR